MTFVADVRPDLELVLGGNVFGWTADRDESFAVLDAFVAAGGSLIDTADSYSQWVPGNTGGESESIIGAWMASRGNRDRLFIGTKVGSLGELNNLRADTIATAVEGSLRRLQTDYLDIYWAHRDDEHTPQDETVAAFDALVRAGKVRYLGASNFSAARVESAVKIAAATGAARFEAIQPLYNLLDHVDFEAALGPVAALHNLATFPYYGLAAGFLSGKYRRGIEVQSARSARVAGYATDRGYRTVDALAEIAQRRGVPMPAVALAWLRVQPTVLAPIASARTPEQLADLVAMREVSLTSDELAALREAAA